MDNTMNERRLSIGEDGTVKGKFPGVITSQADKTKMSIGANANAINDVLQNVNVASTLFPSAPSLTAQQRLTELKKKIAEYKTLLSIVTDATTKNFVLQLLSNIDSELSQIQTEIGKISVQPQYPVYPQPFYPPYQPGVVYDTTGPLIGGIKQPDLSFTTTCVGKTCVTYPTAGLPQNQSLSETTLTNVKKVVWDEGMPQESIQYISEDGK
jgi:hypothetical protein